MEEKMIAIDGRSLQVSCTGIGPVTLLILSGSNILFPGLEYAPLADALSPWYSVLIPSKFGYGHSGLTDAPRDVDTVVEEYRGVLAALERPLPVVLAAHSMGFLEALHWARKYPGGGLRSGWAGPRCTAGLSAHGAGCCPSPAGGPPSLQLEAQAALPPYLPRPAEALPRLGTEGTGPCRPPELRQCRMGQ